MLLRALLLVLAGTVVACSSADDAASTLVDSGSDAAHDDGTPPDAPSDTSDTLPPACDESVTYASVAADTSYCGRFVETYDECGLKVVGRVGYGYEKLSFDATTGKLVRRTDSTDTGTKVLCQTGAPRTCDSGPSDCAFVCFTTTTTLVSPRCPLLADGGVDGG